MFSVEWTDLIDIIDTCTNQVEEPIKDIDRIDDSNQAEEPKKDIDRIDTGPD